MSATSFKDLYSLKGKNAIVTGGAGILGKNFCSGLAEFGANVAIVDVNQELAQQVAEEISDEYNVRTIALHCDITSPQEVQEMVKKVVDEFGEINILHNNAASKSNNLEAFFEKFEDQTVFSFRLYLTINVYQDGCRTSTVF